MVFRMWYLTLKEKPGLGAKSNIRKLRQKQGKQQSRARDPSHLDTGA